MAIVTLCDMIDECRRLLDDVSTQIVPSSPTNLQLLEQAAEEGDESELLWKTPELKNYANEAVKEVALRTRCLIDNSGTADFNEFDFVVNQTDTPMLDHRILVIKRVLWNGAPLERQHRHRLDYSKREWWTDTIDAPTGFMMTHPRVITVYPKPTVIGTLKIECIRLPLVEMTASSDEPEIPLQWRKDAVSWMCHLAYQKNDADTKDAQQSDYYEGVFARRFGPAVNSKLQQIEFFNEGAPIRAVAQYY